MVRNYKCKTENAGWSENDLQAAIKCIKNKTITCSKATEFYKIPRSTSVVLNLGVITPKGVI